MKNHGPRKSTRQMQATIGEQPLLQCMEVRGGHGQASNFYQRPGLDVWVWSQVRQNTGCEGGDMHYISSCASGRITRLLLADVGGIDNLFADVAERMRDLMKRNINVIAQGSAVEQMGANMDVTSERGGFASTLLSTYFAPTRSLTVCNAGHPPPLLYHSSTGAWSVLRAESMARYQSGDPSGTVERREYQRMKRKLDVGDMVFCYSDALTECRKRDGRLLGLAGLQDRLRQLDTTSGSENLLVDLACGIRDEHPENLCERDATVLLARVTHTPVSLRDNFLAPFRVWRKATDRTSF